MGSCVHLVKLFSSVVVEVRCYSNKNLCLTKNVFILRIIVIEEGGFWLSKGLVIFCDSCQVAIFTVYPVTNFV